MPRLDDSYPEILAALADRYGRPVAAIDRADPFASVLMALLERSIESRKVAAILDSLRDAGLLDPSALADADPAEIASIIRPSGGSAGTRALGPLRRLSRWFADRGPFEDWSEVPTSHLREELISLPGIGPASADAILLFGLGRPVYPVDRPSYRILVRHGWLDPSAEYDEARDLLEHPALDDPAILARLSIWLERVGKDHCRATVAKCDRCPLRPFLPEGGPIEEAS